MESVEIVEENVSMGVESSGASNNGKLLRKMYLWERRGKFFVKKILLYIMSSHLVDLVEEWREMFSDWLKSNQEGEKDNYLSRISMLRKEQ